MSLKYNLSPQQLARIEELRNCTPEKWESICKGCGLCCLCKVGLPIAPGVEPIVFTDLCCNHFDTKTKKCTVYKNRFKKCNDCCKVTLDIVLDGTLLPAGCGYVEYIFGPAPRPAKVNWNQISRIGNIDISKQEGLQHLLLSSLDWRHR